MALLLALSQKLAQGFSAFWVRWPKKVGKQEAEQAWKKYVRPEDEEPIHKALDWQVPILEQREWEYIPHAKTWIRNRRWEDEPPAPPRPKLPPPTRFTQMAAGSDRPVSEQQAAVRARLAEEWGQK